MEEYPVIIIGAGIGGLTTAAYLSKIGIPSALIEKTSFAGGRCSTRVISGSPYEIGALYLGGGVFDRLRTIFNVKVPSLKIRCGVKINGRLVSFPVGLKTALELTACHVSLPEMLGMRYRSRLLSKPTTFETYKSVGEVFDFLTENAVLRKFLHSTAGLSGVRPYRLPANYLYSKSPLARYRSQNPEYVIGGNGEIPRLLLQIALKGSHIFYDTEVKKITVKDGHADAVETTRGMLKGNLVVSNAGLRKTILGLVENECFPFDYRNRVKGLGETLRVVNIFLTFSHAFKFPKGFSVFLMPYDVDQEFLTLDSGAFPLNSMYVLQVPSNVEPASRQDHRATLQFYYPRGDVAPGSLDNQVKHILQEGLEDLFKGLSGAVTGYVVYDPTRYEKEFGFAPYVFGVSPDLQYARFPVETPIDNLFCVGDSVEPDGPCVPQAMESGLECARMIARRLGVKTPGI
ncbi:MAG: protoporphyrinogen oxidase [Syntrophorhabdus sp. PtaU1.Bin002]|nr:MAG: protoporphyrinogen oxidase [Syntrophorhabdus sp. PtaB.Bin006]OPY71480.1 MAG: protoporphyrinogen oxidase [Syntrophorhabdus sp. PtaU1.Bin002]